mgnify:FL=1
MEKHYVHVQRTARYFQSRKIDENIKRVIFVLHGYAQNADDFLKDFEKLDNKQTLIVAPEGLSKFYWKDFTSAPSSSWMTSLERENEIEDTLKYLDQVCLDVRGQLPKEGVEYSCLGFSQGAATASRFCAHSLIIFSNLFLYGGGPAHDLDWASLPVNLKFHLIYGDKDVFISDSQVKKVEGLIQSKKFKVQSYRYEGKHKIEDAGLDYIKSVIDK